MIRVLYGKIVQDTFRDGADILVTFRNPPSKKGEPREQIRMPIDEYNRLVRRISRASIEATALLTG